MERTLKVSVIIPVYNEERHITACLDALTAQTTAPDEIIVVDNNSTDQTAELAKKYKGVIIVKEKEQGLIAARNRGFREASGDILCRIDADAVLTPDWTERVHSGFSSDPELAGMTGLALTRVLPRIPALRTTFYSMGYFWWTWYLFRGQVLWGANMAVRRSWWEKVRGDIQLDNQAVHEDQDLSLCLLARGGQIKLDKSMLIVTDGQTYNYAPKLISYIRRAVNTRRLARAAGRFPVPADARMSAWKIALAALAVYTLGVAFLIESLLLWPLDKLMIALGREKAWID